MITKQELTETLKQGVYEVTFTKLNGEVRTMPCTLKEDILPPAKQEDPLSLKRVRAVFENDKVLVVYCTDKNEWRSFRVANVTEVKQLV